jgi:hypothetical protein
MNPEGKWRHPKKNSGDMEMDVAQENKNQKDYQHVKDIMKSLSPNLEQGPANNRTATCGRTCRGSLHPIQVMELEIRQAQKTHQEQGGKEHESHHVTG